MSTAEKRYLLISERKNRILQQVKQQIDLYHQNLACKLLLDGIDPPLWLWNPYQSSSDVQKVLNKEELISEIFLPRAQPPVGFSNSHCYLYNQSVGHETGEILDGSCKVTHGCNNGDTGTEQSHAAGFEDNNAGYGVDTVPEVEVSVTSPGDETEPRISNIYAPQEQSLVRIQRSKSRQKALELRSSEKSKTKSITLAGPPAQDRSSFSGNKVVDLVNGLGEVAEPFVISRENSKLEESDEDDSWKKEKEIIVSPGNFNSLRNSATSVMDGLKADSSNYIQESNFAQESYNRDISRYHVDDDEDVATDSCEACEERAGHQGVDKGNYTNTSGGRMLRSSQQPCCLNEAPVTNKLNKSAECKEGVLPKLGNDATESCTLREFSNGLALERRNTKTISCDDGFTTLPYNPRIGSRDRSSESGESFAKKIECHSILGDEAAMPCADSKIVTSPRSNVVAVDEDKLMPNDHVKDLSLNSMLISGITRVDCLARTSSDCLRSVGPVQLNFEGTDGCNVNEMSCITLQSRRQEVSAKEVLGNSLDPQVSYGDHIWSAQENAPLEGLQESSEKIDAHIGPFESTSEEHVEDHMKESSFSASAKEVFGNSLDPQVSYGDHIWSAQQNAPLEGLQESSEKIDAHIGPFESTSEDHVEDHMKESRFSASAKEVFGNSLDPQVSYGDHIWSAQQNAPLEGLQESSEKIDSHIGPFESTSEEHVEDHMKESKFSASAKEVFGNSLDPQVSCGDHIWSAQENAPLERLQESSEKIDAHIGPFESTSEEHVEDLMKESRSSAIQYTTSQTSQDNLEVLQVQVSTPTHQGNNKSNAFQTSSAENYMGVLSKEGNELLPEFQSREYQSTPESKEKNTSMPHAQRNHLENNYYGGKEDLVMIGSIDSTLGDDKDLDSLKAWEIQFPEKLPSAEGFSWPPKKRRKIEDNETSCFSALPSFRIPTEQMKATNLTMNIGDEKETLLEQSNPVSNCTGEQIYLKMSSQLTKTTESSPEYGKNESTLIYEVLAQHEDISSSPCSIQGEEPVPSTSVEEIGGVSQGCLMNKLNFVSGTSSIRKYQKNDSVDEALVNSEGLVDADRTVLNGSYTDVDSVLGNFVETPTKMDLEIIGADQIMPVLEGFIMDSDTSNEKVDVSGNEISFDILELTKTSVERASILEKICKSASTESPFTYISSAFKFQNLHTCHLSMPNGLLESADSKSVSALNGHVYNHIRSKGVDGIKGSFHEVSRSDCLPYSKSRYWDSLNPFISPVGKLWEKINSNSDSSGKKLSSNPELTCFPIEEDPDSSEENEDFSVPVDNNVDEVVYTCREREALADISASHSNGRSVREADMYASKSSSTPSAAEVKCKPTHNKSKGKGGKHSKSTNEEKENDSLLTGAIEMNKVNDSLNNRYSKISSSFATSSRTEQHKLLGKETMQNNIVSNVTSFIPLVQQKQAAAVCKGKRDIKVKALEDAENTKRQQEKRDQERKLRKEAVKLERARVEQENLRLTEENKKRKEEERKKKDAEVVAKKRIREEEERKEKERKKRRMEEARSQRLEEGKLANNKVDKGKQQSIMGGENKKKGANNEVRKCKGFSKESSDMKLTTNGFTSDVHDERPSLDACGTSGYSFDHLKVTPAVAKSTENNIVQKIREKSYEISPYQCSDEEEDEDDVPNKKSIPSWASKRCVALVLPLQQGIEPDVIFPPDSFCSTAEVVCPRK